MPDLSETGVKPPVVKLSRPSLREFTRTAKSQVDDRVTRVTEPEVTLTEAQLLKLSSEAVDKEDFAAKAIKTIEWGEFDVEKLIDILVALRKAITGIELHEGYQMPFERRVYSSMLRNDGDELTLLISRQGGKTELLSCIVPTLCLVLPALAAVFPQLNMYAKGVFVGIYAPSGEQASTLYSRVLGRSNSAAAEEIMADPDFNIYPIANTRWSNGSFVFHQSADPRSKVESKTYHLLLGEETQGLQYRTIEKSLIPMVASTNGTIILVGTAVDFKCYFHDAIIRNKVDDIRNPENRKHYEYDYTEVQKYNPRYAAHVAKMIKRYGIASPYFQMSYCNKFLLEEGMAVTERDFKANTMLSSYGITRRSDRPVTVGIDQARKRNKTIVTVAELTQTTLDFEDGATPETRHSTRVIAWLELDKIAWSMQRKLIAQFLTGFSDIRKIAFDSTGPGDANYESFVEEYPEWPTMPVIFSSVSKEQMKDIFYEYYWSKRLQIPTDKRARQSKEWQAFWLEWVNVEKVTVNNRTYFRKNDKVGASDDYVDSLLLMLLATEEYMKSGHDGTEVAANLIFRSPMAPTSSPSFAALRARHREGGSATINGMRDARHAKLIKGMIA